MFDKLFKRPDTVEAYSSAPLANERLNFLHHLRESGAGAISLRQHACSQLRLVRLLDLTDRAPVGVAQTEAAVRSAAGGSGFPQQASASAIRAFVGDVVRWMRFLGRLQEPEELRHPHSAEVDAWLDWMCRDRGLSEATASARRHVVEAFFDRLAPSGTFLSAITISDIDRTFAAWHAERQFGRRTRSLYARVRPRRCPASPGHDRGESAGRHPRPGPADALHRLRSQGRGGRRTAAGRRRLAGGDASHPLPEAGNHTSPSALARCRERAPALSSRSPPPTF